MSTMDSAVEAARRIVAAADGVSAFDGASRRAAIKRLNAATDDQYGVIQIARALLSSQSQVERMREALTKVRAEIHAVWGEGTDSTPLMDYIDAALNPKEPT